MRRSHLSTFFSSFFLQFRSPSFYDVPFYLVLITTAMWPEFLTIKKNVSKKVFFSTKAHQRQTNTDTPPLQFLFHLHRKFNFISHSLQMLTLKWMYDRMVGGVHPRYTYIPEVHCSRVNGISSRTLVCASAVRERQRDTFSPSHFTLLTHSSLNPQPKQQQKSFNRHLPPHSTNLHTPFSPSPLFQHAEGSSLFVRSCCNCAVCRDPPQTCLPLRCC